MVLQINRIHALTTAQLTIPFVAIWAIIYYATLPWILVSLMMFFFMRVIGGAITYHRIHNHRTHTMNPIMELVCTAFGFYGSLMSPLEFCVSHDNHHKYHDTDKDPHPCKLKGWKVIFPILWNDSLSSENLRTLVRLKRNKIVNFFYEKYWFLLLLPFLLLLISLPAYLFIYIVPLALSLLSTSTASLNHDENGPKNMGFWYGILSGGEHMHKHHHDRPYDTSKDGWINTVTNIIATKRIEK
jgi:fatty-acid desaturase